MKTLKPLSKFILTICLLITVLVSLQAQRAGQDDATRGGLMRSFNAAAPAVGTKIPFLEGVDAEGKPWNTDQLKGKHTVLVFGCLT